MPNFKHFLIAIVVFFTPIVGLLLSVGSVIILDTITGIYRSIKTGGWASFNSKSFGHVVGKLVLYNLSIITIYVMDKLLLGEFTKHWFQIDFLATKVVAMMLLFIELTSIKENIEETFGFNIFDKLKSAFQRSKELKDDFNDLTS